MRRIVALWVVLASCEPFPDEDRQYEGGRGSFEAWKEAMIAGRLGEVVAMTTVSLRSQWIYDRLLENDPAALDWKGKLKGGARSDLDLWFGEAGKNTSSGRVPTLPATVLREPTLTTLLTGYLKDAQADMARDFKSQKVVQVASDDRGVSVLVHNKSGDAEIYQLSQEDGYWKVDGHRRAPSR